MTFSPFSTVFIFLQFVCTVLICKYSQNLTNGGSNNWRSVIYEKLFPTASISPRYLDDPVQVASHAVAQGHSMANDAMTTASHIITAVQAVASEVISKLSLDTGAEASNNCADYVAPKDLNKLADMLSDAAGNRAWNLAQPPVGGTMTTILLIAISSLVAYLASIWPLHGIRLLLLPALTLLSVFVTCCMLVVVLVILYLRGRAANSAGLPEASASLTDAIICFVASAVQSVASLVELQQKQTAASSPPSASAADTGAPNETT